MKRNRVVSVFLSVRKQPRTFSYEEQEVLASHGKLYFLSIIGYGDDQAVARKQAEAMLNMAKNLSEKEIEELTISGEKTEACFLCTEPKHGEASLRVTRASLVHFL
jgi:hypothetical protein